MESILDGQARALASAEEQRKFLQPIPVGQKKYGRNEPCPCGSGKKFKNCHLHKLNEARNTIHDF